MRVKYACPLVLGDRAIDCTRWWRGIPDDAAAVTDRLTKLDLLHASWYCVWLQSATQRCIIDLISPSVLAIKLETCCQRDDGLYPDVPLEQRPT